MSVVHRILPVILMAGMALASGAQAQPRGGLPSVEELKRQLAPPKPGQNSDADDEEDGPGTRSLTMPSTDGSCDARAMRALDEMETQPASHRNLEVMPAAQVSAPQVTLDLQFGYASYQLSPVDKAQLDRLAEALNSPELRHSRYAIRGHTDSSGDAIKNLRLSCGRALEAKQYLVEKGRVNEARLAAFGFGSLRPLRRDDAGDGANRRVEIRWVR